MRKLLRRIHFLLDRRRLERELAEEMAIHREMMPPELRKTFGNVTRLQEESGEAWSWIWCQQLWQDLRYGVRNLWGARSFTLGAVAVLALGIGVNLAEFQIFDALIFHRIAIRDANALLQLFRDAKEGQRGGFPAAAVEFYRAESHSFAWLVSEDTSVDVTVEEDDTAVRSNLVHAAYFSDLGIVPSWGRLFDALDGKPGAPPVAVLGYGYWQRRWGSDPHVIGQVVRINNQPVQIVGVTPYDFDGLAPRNTSVWLPVSRRPQLVAGSPPIQQDFSRASESLFGKLKAGVSQAAGEAELTSLTRELIRRQPRSFRNEERIQSHLVQNSMAYRAAHAPAFAIFIVMILLVLFSACANLGNMLLTRGLARQREINIRLAIGASRARIIRQLMTESFLLAILGCMAGIAFGVMSARLLLYALSAPVNIRLQLSWPLLGVGLLLTFLSVIVFGLPSAFQTIQPVHRSSRLRQILVGVQVAVSCLLLIASSVLAHNGILDASLNVAFDYQKMVVVVPQIYTQNLQPAVAQQKLDALTVRLSALPGVRGITAALAPPFGGRIMMDSLPGLPHIYRNAVASSYFSVMNLPVLRGRTFLPGEQNAVIVSESAARAVWPNQDPIGKTWNLAGSERTITGLVKDSGANLLADSESIEAYVPIQGANIERSALILLARGDPARLTHMISTTAAASGEAVSVLLMRSAHDDFIESQEKTVILIGSIGVVATALAAAGMFALVAFAVARRKRELGIRIAIGARPNHILTVLLEQNARPMVIGMMAGAILAMGLARLVHSTIVLQNHNPVDIIGFVAGLVCFMVVAVLATLSPAIRALRIDPSVTLREE
jgi:predicted permease